MSEKKIELTQKELDKKLDEARKVGYEIVYPERPSEEVLIRNLVKALKDFFDERYERFHDNY